MERKCPCGAPPRSARGMPRCDNCVKDARRDYHREYKRREQRAADVKAGREPGSILSGQCRWCERTFSYVLHRQPRQKCDDCKKRSGAALNAAWRSRNPDRAREHKRRYVQTPQGVAAVQGYNREIARYKKYSVDRDWYLRTLAAQGGLCANAGCRAAEPGGRFAVWHIDHDRACCPGSRSCGRCVRGLLCNGCNIAAGHLRDSLARIEGLAAYLRVHRAAREQSALI